MSPSAHGGRADDASAAAAAAADRTQQRADRSEQRATPSPEASASADALSPSPVPVSPSPSTPPPPPPPTTPSKTAPAKTAGPKPTPPSGGGTVVSSGTCQASFYTDEGSRTANGETFHTSAFTAAHKTLPFNTRVRVTNVNNGKSVVVRINDRGPFVANRCLDLTPAAFNTISSTSAGVATVKFEVLQG
ncbi:septal ring lytic transglycosylase RlpA family protein [Planosporangium thailandense]|uniref:septal ring lytic transglycosylase RlpA family protein n=1 Tax=Planosporangium thailandense TaxID=765197 RepID=UPI0023F76249|nr:septal ring lytic transglycosylase RlpA family protein [Planosporangium thailandense]